LIAAIAIAVWYCWR